MNNLRIIVNGFAFLLGFSCLMAQGEDVYQKGIDYYFQGDHEKALVYLDSAIQLNSNDISRFFFRAKINEKLERYTAAIQDLTECIIRSDHDEMYLTKRAVFYERIGNISQALADYSESIALKPHWESYYRRGLILFQQNQLKNALDDFNKSIKYNSNQADPWRARAFLKLKTGDKEGACSDMQVVFDMGYDDVRDWLSKNCG